MDEFEAMLKKARKERDEKVSERMVLDHEITALDKTIEGLTMLCELPPEEPAAVTSFAEEMLKYAGLTDAVQMCLQASPMPLSAAEVVAKLKDAAYPTEQLDNPRAAVNTILNRLVTGGKVQRKERGGDVLYSWISGFLEIRKRNLDALQKTLATKTPQMPFIGGDVPNPLGKNLAEMLKKKK
jgi:predicted transcriptional regulator